ncbi:hypothetical protein J6TS2_50540 [Heyndrickxia sporothermodurans]|nr:hypothetical protein J6TS2_50540 [Heyndrickxia sporothermodurans]
MSNDVINVGLYGGKGIFGGKETPLEASVISCDKYESCSYYENNQCLAVRSISSAGCKYGKVNTVRGYTSRAKKYSQFKREWQNHEQYNKLSYPPQKIGVIDGVIVFPYPFIKIEKQENGKHSIQQPGLFNNSASFIEIEKFNTDLIYRICSYRPQALMGGEIASYQKEKVPLFLSHLREVLPEIYEKFIAAYPKFGRKIDYVGRKALLKTIKPSLIEYRSRDYPNLNNDWYWDGECLNYKWGYVSSVSVINDYEVVEFKLKPSEQTTVKISSNEQVTEQTIFVD